MHPYILTLKNYYQAHTARSRIILSVLALIIVLGIARIVLPHAIIYSSVSWLSDQGITADIEDITIDIFNGSIILKNASGTDSDNRNFVIGDIEVFWDWSPLSEKNVQVIRIKLDNIKFDIEQYSDLMIVSGVKILPSEKSDETPTDTIDESTPWGTSLKTIELSNIALCYQQHNIEHSTASDDTRDVDYCLHLDEMNWNGELSYKLNNQLQDDESPLQLYYSSNGNFHLNNFVITDNLLEKTFIDIEEFDLNGVMVNSLNDISLASVVLSNVSSMQRDDKEHIDAARIKKLTISNVSFKNLNHLKVEAIDIHDPGLYIQKDKAGQWEYSRWMPKSSSANKTHSSDGIATSSDTENNVAVSEENLKADNGDNESKNSFTAELGSVTIHNSDFCYDDESNDLYTCFTQQLLSWTGNSTIKSAEDLGLIVQGELQLQQTNIQNQKAQKQLLALQSFSVKNIDIQSLDDISIGQINFDKLQGLQRSGKGKDNVVRVNQLTLSDLSLNKMQKLSIKDITLDTPDLFLLKDKKGNFEFERLIPKLENKKASQQKTKTAQSKSSSNSFSTSIGNIKILHSDLCYRDDSEKLHYCFLQANTTWTGNININPAKDIFTAKGKLLSSSTRIQNKLIDRELLRLQTFSISQANIKSVKDISVGNIKLTKLLALERAKKSNSYTLWLDSISIDDMALSNSDLLEINSIRIKEPGLQVSKAKDAKWEHDKWLPAPSNKQPNKPSTSAKPDTADSPSSKPFNIVLKQFKVSTRQKITFTDNSLTPTMKVGMKKVDLIVNNIDSTKPKQRTTFELDAQSSRHATIDLKGYALPFAEKPSFDANGELLGFDMRAASPAAQKAIGHFIKSGQMDAELTLLAEDGILDSNIALTLNHFNLEAASEEDAEELDATFGMPVNQSLSLLRDKDDSIHLDLPITGDINNPEFDPSDAIIKATTKATTIALITFYTPYGLVYAGGNLLFDLATAMDFPPLVFEPGKTALNQAHKDQLDSLSTMLTEKPQLHMTFCGTTNLKDRLALYPRKLSADKKPENDQSNEAKEKIITLPPLPKLTKEQRSKLEAIADARQKNTKSYLIENAKIKHSRLIICAPAYSAEDDVISGVDIAI